MWMLSPSDRKPIFFSLLLSSWGGDTESHLLFAAKRYYSLLKVLIRHQNPMASSGHTNKASSAAGSPQPVKSASLPQRKHHRSEQLIDSAADAPEDAKTLASHDGIDTAKRRKSRGVVATSATESAPAWMDVDSTGASLTPDEFLPSTSGSPFKVPASTSKQTSTSKHRPHKQGDADSSSEQKVMLHAAGVQSQSGTMASPTKSTQTSMSQDYPGSSPAKRNKPVLTVGIKRARSELDDIKSDGTSAPALGPATHKGRLSSVSSIMVTDGDLYRTMNATSPTSAMSVNSSEAASPLPRFGRNSSVGTSEVGVAASSAFHHSTHGHFRNLNADSPANLASSRLVFLRRTMQLLQMRYKDRGGAKGVALQMMKQLQDLVARLESQVNLLIC